MYATSILPEYHLSLDTPDFGVPLSLTEGKDGEGGLTGGVSCLGSGRVPVTGRSWVLNYLLRKYRSQSTPSTKIYLTIFIRSSRRGLFGVWL